MRAEHIRSALVAAMKERGLDKQQVATATGISRPTISRLVNGLVENITDDTAERLQRWVGGTQAGYSMHGSTPMILRDRPHDNLVHQIADFHAWLLRNPDAWPFVLNAAKGCGYKEA